MAKQISKRQWEEIRADFERGLRYEYKDCMDR